MSRPRPCAPLLALLPLTLGICVVPAWAETAPAVPAAEAKPAAPEPPPSAEATPAPTPVAEKRPPVPRPPLPLTCKCPQAKPPLYVEDWGRLAALTQTDREVFDQADFWRRREEASRWMLAGMFVGGTAAAVATIDRLATSSWNDTNKWALAGGIGLALFSFLGYWAYSPDRDDLLTVINSWNLRHGDMLLAP
jgi:hypothetical protein